MNPKDKNPNYKQIYSYVKRKFDNTLHFGHGPFDETYYTMRVYESAKEIICGLKEHVNKEQVLVAALLHDIGKTKLDTSKVFSSSGFRKDSSEEWHKHATLGMPLAKRYLKKLGHSDEFIKSVLYLIENHDKRKDELESKSTELKVLQDADLIADIGLAGFIRSFLYSGKFNRSIIGSIRFSRSEDRTSGGDRLNLSVSKKIARKEKKIQDRLVQTISKEIESDLLTD